MRPLIPWRGRAALWLLVPGVIGVLAYSVQFASETSTTGYWPAAIAGSAIFLAFSCAVAATAGAWEGHRYRAAGAAVQTSGRSTAAVLVNHLWTPLVAGVVIQAIAVGVMSGDTWGAPGNPSALVAVTFVSIVFFHSCLGFTVGRWLPPVASLPLSLLASYSWLGFTWSVDYFPLRYLAGFVLSDCCSVETTLDVRAPIIATAFSVIAGACLLLIAVARRTAGERTIRFGAHIGASALVIVTVVALLSGSGLGASPIVERPQSQSVCRGHEPTICLFPEQRVGADPDSVIRQAAGNLSHAGIAIQPTIRTSNGRSTPDVLNMIVQVRMTKSDLVHSITTSVLGDAEVAYCGSESDYSVRINDGAVANRWLIDTASRGITAADQVPPALEIDDPATLRELLRAGPADQAAWVSTTIHRLNDCSVGHVEVPTS